LQSPAVVSDNSPQNHYVVPLDCIALDRTRSTTYFLTAISIFAANHSITALAAAEIRKNAVTATTLATRTASAFDLTQAARIG
jgi:hypothetical protein